MLPGMTVRQLIRALGGGAAVAQRCGVTRQAVSHWVRDDAAPKSHHVTLWTMASEAKLPWQPPNADAIRHLVATTAPSAKAEAA
jgi:transcriptional regulator with XRE-family HTH domain